MVTSKRRKQSMNTLDPMDVTESGNLLTLATTTPFGGSVALITLLVLIISCVKRSKKKFTIEQLEQTLKINKVTW